MKKIVIIVSALCSSCTWILSGNDSSARYAITSTVYQSSRGTLLLHARNKFSTFTGSRRIYFSILPEDSVSIQPSDTRLMVIKKNNLRTERVRTYTICAQLDNNSWNSVVSVSGSANNCPFADINRVSDTFILVLMKSGIRRAFVLDEKKIRWIETPALAGVFLTVYIVGYRIRITQKPLRMKSNFVLLTCSFLVLDGCTRALHNHLTQEFIEVDATDYNRLKSGFIEEQIPFFAENNAMATPDARVSQSRGEAILLFFPKVHGVTVKLIELPNNTSISRLYQPLVSLTPQCSFRRIQKIAKGCNDSKSLRSQKPSTGVAYFIPPCFYKGFFLNGTCFYSCYKSSYRLILYAS